MSENKGKDTIYVDVDEEITGIVSKIQNSQKDIVALVLPKRASVLQSIVNMKLIKRTAEQNDKKVVLITSESRLLPLAGASGLFVAANLTSKPYVPISPVIDGQGLGTEDGAIDPNTPVSEVAPDAKFADDDAIEIDNRPKPDAGSAAKGAKSKKKKGLRVPNFGKFRTRLIIGVVAAIFLISGILWALLIAPKATVVLKTQTSELPVNVSFIADSAATEFDPEGKVVRGIVKETQKQDSEKVEATGQKNKGNKASGSVKFTNCSKNDKLSDTVRTIPAGTGISANGLTYITSSATTVEPSGFNGDNCKKDKESSSVSVIAQLPGENYNSGAQIYSVAGFSSMSASGSAMTGGTTQNVKVVSQTDVEKAKERLNGKSNTVQDEMTQELKKEGYVAITDTFQASPSNYIPSPAVDAEASEVTVSVTTTYKMNGAKEDDLKELVKKEVSDQKGEGTNILSDGLDTATFRPSSTTGRLSEGQTAFTVNTTVVTGPVINEEEVKNQITGKKKGQAEDILKQKPGIIEPSVELSPFWVSKIPKASKITIEVKQADGSAINP